MSVYPSGLAFYWLQEASVHAQTLLYPGHVQSNSGQSATIADALPLSHALQLRQITPRQAPVEIVVREYSAGMLVADSQAPSATRVGACILDEHVLQYPDSIIVRYASSDACTSKAKGPPQASLFVKWAPAS